MTCFRPFYLSVGIIIITKFEHASRDPFGADVMAQSRWTRIYEYGHPGLSDFSYAPAVTMSLTRSSHFEKLVLTYYAIPQVLVS